MMHGNSVRQERNNKQSHKDGLTATPHEPMAPFQRQAGEQPS